MTTLTRLSEILSKLNEDERRTVLFIAERVFMGRERYAPMNLATDKRDFAHEAAEESADHPVYVAMLAACDANLRYVLERERAKSEPMISRAVLDMYPDRSRDDDEWPEP